MAAKKYLWSKSCRKRRTIHSFLSIAALAALTSISAVPASVESQQADALASAPAASSFVSTRLLKTISVSADKFSGVFAVDVESLVKEKSSLGFASTSDEEFLKSVRRCLAAESARRLGFIFGKTQCWAGCTDITNSIREQLKAGANQAIEAPVWSACASYKRAEVIMAWPEALRIAKLLQDREAAVNAKVDSCKETYERARKEGYGVQELALLQQRLQGEIDSFGKAVTEDASKWEAALENTICYASSVFASQNKLNYVFEDGLSFTKSYSITAPLSKYVSGLKSTSLAPLEGPNPYKIGVVKQVNFSEATGYTKADLEAACEAVRKKKQLRAVVHIDAVRCGGIDVTGDVLSALRTNGR